MTLPFQLTGSTFCDISSTKEQSLAVIGAPFDGGTSMRSGTRDAPISIRQVSRMLTDGVYPTYPYDIKQWVQDLGNIELPTGDTIATLVKLEETFDKLKLQNVATLGGDHTITLGILRSLAKTYGPVSIVHFDAHCDTWTDHFGQLYGHGSWLYHAINEKLVDPNRTISIGIRSPVDKITKEFLSTHGGTTMSARTAMKYLPEHIASIIRTKVGDKNPCYLSLDIDCLDPAFAPGTGTPEIGGLTSIWLLEVLDNLLPITWVGMDCVEVSPPYDYSNITSLAAATFVLQYLSMNISKKFIKNQTVIKV